MELNELLVDAVESFNQYVENLPYGCTFISEKLYKEEYPEALKTIKDFSEGMLWLIECTDLFKQNGLTVGFEIEKIVEFLNEVNSGLQSQDYVLVSDMFEYEIKPYFEQLQPITVSQ